MMNRFFILFVALLAGLGVAGFALDRWNREGQAITSGFENLDQLDLDDEPAYSLTPGQWDAGEQPIVYPLIGPDGNFYEQLGDESTPAGGIPEAYALQPDPIPADETGWITRGAHGSPEGGDTTGDDEFKFRLTLNDSHILADDPIRNHCDRGASHLHIFFGNVHAGACSTFEQLRNSAVQAQNDMEVASTAPGGPLNGTAYWMPAILVPDALGDGVIRAKKVDAIPLYYQIPDLNHANTFIDLPRGLNYVSGRDMDDPLKTRLKDAIAASNAANADAGGPSGAYTYLGDGFVEWGCSSGGTPADNLEDLECPAASRIIAEGHGAECWDGKNLSSPGGYGHVLPAIRVSATNVDRTDVCPVGWFKFPVLVLKPQFGHLTDDDFKSWRLSSDDMFQDTMRAIPGYEDFVCKNGCSFHFDWFGAWQDDILKEGFRFCLGIPNTADPESGEVPHGTGCNSNSMSLTSRLVGGNAPDGTRTPQVDLNHWYRGDELGDYYAIPGGHTGPDSVHNH